MATALNPEQDKERARNTPAKADIQEARRRLQALVTLPDSAAQERRAILIGLTESSRLFHAMDAAIVSIADDQLRRQITGFFMREGDVGLDNAGARTVAHVVAVGAVFEGPAPIQDPLALQRLFTGSSSDVIPLGVDSPEHPGREAGVLVAPMYDWRCLHVLLCNTYFSLGRTVPGATHPSWENLAGDTPRPCVSFLFSPPASEINKAGEAWTFSGPFFDRCMDAITRRVQQINEAYPEARLTLRAPAQMSHAVQPLQETALVLAVNEELRLAQEEFETSRGKVEVNPGGNPPLWAGFTTAIVSLTTWEKALHQTVDILFVNREVPDSSALPLRYVISGLSTVSSLQQRLADALTLRGIVVESMPSAPTPMEWRISKPRELYRDIDGRWLPWVLFQRPYGGRQLVNDDKCIANLRAESVEDLRATVQHPVPLLYSQAELSRLFQAHFRADVATRVLALADTPGVSHNQATARLKEEFPGLKYLQRNATSSKAEMGLRHDVYLASHFKRCNGRIFHVRQALIERLDFSDIETGVPVAYLRAPFPDCYFHLELPLEIRAGEALTEETRLHGFYVTQQSVSDQEWLLAIAPVVTKGADMLYGRSGELELTLASTDSRGLLEVLNEKVVAGGDQHLTPQNEIYRMLDLCAKILLYIGLRSARLVNRPEKTRALEQLAGKSPGERKRQAKRAADLYDFIEVGPEKSMRQEQAEDAARHSTRVFWRRGYFRMQAYGPRWTLHRQRWIQPTLVNADLLSEGGKAPPGRHYRVGGTEHQSEATTDEYP